MGGKNATLDEKEQAEKQAAELLAKAGDFMTKDLPALTEDVKALKNSVEEFKKIDVASAVKEIEKVRAAQEKLSKQIRSDSRNPAFVPGLEDEVQKFSMIRMCMASRFGWEKAGAGFEKEVVDAAIKALHAKAGGAMGDDKQGGFWVPDQVIPDVIAAIYARSVLFNLSGDGTTRVSVLNGLTGGNVKIPKVTGGLVAYWVGEEEEPAESMDQAGDITLNPKKMMLLLKLTDSMRRFGGFGFEQMLRNDMINVAAEKFDWTILYGNGSADQPRGVLNTNGIKIYSIQSGKYGVLGTDALSGAQFQADWTGGSLTFDALDQMRLALEEDKIRLGSDYATISSPRAFAWLRELKVDNYSGQTSNQPYLLGLPVLSDARLTDLIGEFDKTPQILSNMKPGASIGAPSASGTAKFTDVLTGNLREIVIGRWSGLEIEDDQGRGPGFKSDHIYVKLRMYADIGVRQPRGIILCPDGKVRA